MKKDLLKLALGIVAMSVFSAANAQFEVPAAAGLADPVAKVEVTAAQETIVLDGYAENGYTDALNFINYQEGEDLVTGAADFSASAKLTWNYGYLYILWEVNDNEAHTGTDPSYLYDNVELFININIDSTETEGTSNFGDDAIQLRFNRGESDFYDHDGFGWNAKVDTTATDTIVPSSDDIDYYLEDDGSKWIVEAQIPWQVIMPDGKLPDDIHDYVANVMGLDLSAGDSDGNQGTAGARDAVLFWDGDDAGIGNAWYDTRVFGAMKLAGTPTSDVKESNVDVSDLKTYSRNGELIIRGIENAASLQVINMLGQVVVSTDNISANEMVVSSNELKRNSVYVVRAQFVNGKVETSKVIFR